MFLIQKKWLHFTWQGRAVQTALSLDEGLRQVVHIHYIDQVSPEYQDKLVHLSGSLQTERVRVMSFLPLSLYVARQLKHPWDLMTDFSKWLNWFTPRIWLLNLHSVCCSFLLLIFLSENLVFKCYFWSPLCLKMYWYWRRNAFLVWIRVNGYQNHNYKKTTTLNKNFPTIHCLTVW